jgi:predicted MFS family arabinose efflux permease
VCHDGVMPRRSWLVLVTGAAMVFLTMGTRQSLGLFLKPVVADFESNRESFALSVASQNLILGLPLAAMVADRLGPRRVVAFAGLLLGTGLLLAAQAESMLLFGVAFSVLVGFAVSGASFVVVIGAVAKAVPPGKQSFAFGMITAGASFGIFALVPIVQLLIDAVGWRGTLTVLGVVSVVLIALASRLLPADNAQPMDVTAATEPMTQAVRRAFKNRNYILLTSGFFVCGFHVAFIASHLPAYLTDEGLSERTAAVALSLIGLFNIFGSLAAGWLGDRYRRRTLLASLYLARALLMTVFLILPLTTATALIFGAIMGVLWLATVPLTSGLVAAFFGPRYLSTLFGIVFMSHQMGAFLGVWLGGRVYDATGGYQPVWVIAVVLGALAAAIHLPISPEAETATSRSAELEPELT